MEFPPTSSESEMTKAEKRGRNLLLFVFVLTIVADVFLTVVLGQGKRFDEMWRSLGRNCLTLGFIYVVWMGLSWARWLMVAMMFFTCFTAVSFLIARFQPRFVFLAAAFFTAGCSLAFSKGITAFMTFQQNRK
jgi:hypothetical protein